MGPQLRTFVSTGAAKAQQLCKLAQNKTYDSGGIVFKLKLRSITASIFIHINVRIRSRTESSWQRLDTFPNWQLPSLSKHAFPNAYVTCIEINGQVTQTSRQMTLQAHLSEESTSALVECFVVSSLLCHTNRTHGTTTKYICFYRRSKGTTTVQTSAK